MSRTTATNPPMPMPWLCRIGLHARSYSDGVGEEVAPKVWRIRSVPRCNRCHHETGPATYDVMAEPR